MCAWVCMEYKHYDLCGNWTWESCLTESYMWCVCFVTYSKHIWKVRIFLCMCFCIWLHISLDSCLCCVCLYNCVLFIFIYIYVYIYVCVCALTCIFAHGWINSNLLCVGLHDCACAVITMRMCNPPEQGHNHYSPCPEKAASPGGAVTEDSLTRCSLTNCRTWMFASAPFIYRKEGKKEREWKGRGGRVHKPWMDEGRDEWLNTKCP